MTNKKYQLGLSVLGYRCCVLMGTILLAMLVSAQEEKQGALRQRFGRVLSLEERKRVLSEVRASDDIDVSLSSALLYKGLGLFVEKEYEQCVPYLEEAVTLDPSLLSGWEGLGWAYWRLDEKELAQEL
jgi:tetratricopeptide (TPR) repeat protein